jgi:Fe-S cluster biogenesis protein NfuA
MSTGITITPKPTKNDKIYKFEADIFLVQGNSYEFNNIDEAKPSPLAQELFHLPFVKTIFLAQNFVAVEKYDIVSWDMVLEELAKAIEQYLNSGRPLINAPSPEPQSISIYAESTPNPNTMKFVANRALVPKRFEFNSVEQAQNAPLALELFKVTGVDAVFMHQNYISVSKNQEDSWTELIEIIKELVQNFISSGKTVLIDEALSTPQGDRAQTSAPSASAQSDQDKEIIALLEEFVTPAVAGDGGYIAFDSFDQETKTVHVVLQGACSGCPSSTVTLKNGIQSLLTEMTQGRVQNVEAVNG